MKKKLILLLLLVLGLPSVAQAKPVEYGLLAKVTQISKANFPKVKVGDQVYIYYKIDPDVPPAFHNSSNTFYEDSITVADVYFFTSSIFNAYHEGHYKPSRLSNEMNGILGNISGDHVHYAFDLDLKAKSSLPNSNYGISQIDALYYIPFDGPQDVVLPSTFRVSDGETEQFTVNFQNSSNPNDNVLISLKLVQIIFDNPESIEEQI